MSEINKKGSSNGLPLWLIILPIIDFILLFRYLTHNKNLALFNPMGFISNEQFKLMAFTIIVLLIIGIPALFLTYFFAWRYRESSHKAKYNPDTRHGKFFVFSLWAIPTAFMIVLAVVMWSATHRLAPQKSIVSSAKPITVQVVALRWKWLFIYPEQKIATVNFLQIPTDTPIQFDLTADEAPMNSFWIPQLGGQLYAMTGHVNRLNLMANEAGDYRGSAAEISGEGFAGMKFVARASSRSEFDKWVKDTQKLPAVLDAKEYSNLLKPSENMPAAAFAKADADIYAKVLLKYSGSHNHNPEHE
jgi:cytochrome o ubiquinol oxidase subunit II